jgi:hypothetical protein
MLDGVESFEIGEIVLGRTISDRLWFPKEGEAKLR